MSLLLLLRKDTLQRTFSMKEHSKELKNSSSFHRGPQLSLSSRSDDRGQGQGQGLKMEEKKINMTTSLRVEMRTKKFFLPVLFTFQKFSKSETEPGFVILILLILSTMFPVSVTLLLSSVPKWRRNKRSNLIKTKRKCFKHSNISEHSFDAIIC